MSAFNEYKCFGKETFIEKSPQVFRTVREAAAKRILNQID